MAKKIDMKAYTGEDFKQDIHRFCSGRSHPELSQILVDESNAAVKWHAEHGVRFQLPFNRQDYGVDGRFMFWGGLSLKTKDGGKGLIEDLRRAAQVLGVHIVFSTAARRLCFDARTGSVRSVFVQSTEGIEQEVRAAAVILAAGGFE
ncbi:hypothetical protein V8C42DRAFT_311949 [Trichoderma barbatum]